MNVSNPYASPQVDSNGTQPTQAAERKQPMQDSAARLSLISGIIGLVPFFGVPASLIAFALGIDVQRRLSKQYRSLFDPEKVIPGLKNAQVGVLLALMAIPGHLWLGQWVLGNMLHQLRMLP